MKHFTQNIVDEELYRQCKRLTAGILKKPSSIPNRIGALASLEEDPDDSVIVSVVDGDLVKIKYDMDFSEVTHEECSPDYCDGIWINVNVPIKEWTFLLYRAAHEYRDMCQDELSCELAHERALKGERELRLADWRDQGKTI